MIPTSIDGTDITGATIDGTDVTEITVDGDVVFTAGFTIVDDFEDNNLSEWTNFGTGGGSITTDAAEGSFALKVVDGPNNGNFLRNWTVPSGRFELGCEFRWNNTGNFAVFGDFSNTSDNSTGSGFGLTFLTGELVIQTDSGNTQLVNNPNSNQYYNLKVLCDNTNAVIEQVIVDGTTISINEPMLSNNPVSNLIGVRADDVAGQEVYLDNITVADL